MPFAAAAAPRAGSTFRSASGKSPARRSPSPSPSAFSVKTTGVRNSALTRAQRETDRELQRHMQSLLHLKNQLRRMHDDVSKQYTTLTGVLKDAGAMYGELTSDIKQRAENTNVNDESVKKYVNLVHAHLEQVNTGVGEARQAMDELTLHDRQLQHLMVLVDRATDIDMQCLDGSVPDAVIINGSPLFPDLTINDAAEVMKLGTAICAKAGRLATGIRRAITNGRGEAAHSAQTLETRLSTNARMNAESVSSSTRQLQGLRYESARLEKQKATLLEEAEAIEGRLAQVDRTVALRETAKDAIFSRKGTDPVVDVLKRERVELAARRKDLEAKLKALNVQLARVSEDTDSCITATAHAAERTEAYSSAARYCGGAGFSSRSMSNVASPATSARDPSRIASARASVSPLRQQGRLR